MVVAKKSVAKKSAKPAKSGLTVDVVDVKGKVVGSVQLPKEVFGGAVSDRLLAQAAHVYRTNKRQGTSATKTRAEVAYSTRKIYRQKGTGRARHGSRKAPIFVGGGVAFGPKPRVFKKTMNKKQRQQVLFSALAHSHKNKKVHAFSDLVLKLEPKTKVFSQILKNADFKTNNILFVLPKENSEMFMRASRNIPEVSFIDARSINAYEILKAKKLVFFESSMKTLLEHFVHKAAAV